MKDRAHKGAIQASLAGAASLVMAGLVMLDPAAAEGAGPPAGSSASMPATPRTADGHPDLTGNWVGSTGSTIMASFPSSRDAQGNINAGIMSAADAEKAKAFLDQAQGSSGGATRAPSSESVPSYKDPDNLAKANKLYEEGAKTDPVVACGQPGIPRVGAPGKIVQTPKEIIFLYSDLSGMVWRVIPIDGRSFRDRVDPSFYGDSVGHWEGDTLVVEARNFTEETWFGEYGYFHSKQMRVLERLTRHGDTLTYQATVDDPVLLRQPWIKTPITMHLSNVEIEEPLKCVPTSYDMGHHEQRRP
jgi:hypothetical protein